MAMRRLLKSKSFFSLTVRKNMSQKTGTIGEMKDEYGVMDSSGSSYTIKDFQLESGQVLQEAEVCADQFFSNMYSIVFDSNFSFNRFATTALEL